MQKPNRLQKYYSPILAGLTMALLSAHLLFHGGPANVIPWGILALVWGFVAGSKAQAWKLGALYGFSLSFCFLWLDKFGHTTLRQFLELLIIIPLPSLFGALCGAIISRLAFGIRHRKLGLHS